MGWCLVCRCRFSINHCTMGIRKPNIWIPETFEYRKHSNTGHFSRPIFKWSISLNHSKTEPRSTTENQTRPFLDPHCHVLFLLYKTTSSNPVLIFFFLGRHHLLVHSMSTKKCRRKEISKYRHFVRHTSSERRSHSSQGLYMNDATISPTYLSKNTKSTYISVFKRICKYE